MSIQEIMDNFLDTLRNQATEIPELMRVVCKLLYEYLEHNG